MPNMDDLARGRSRCTDHVADEDIDPNAVMPQQCSSCPWRDDGGILQGDSAAIAALHAIVLSQSNQRCHAPGLNGLPERSICRGARNFQLQVFFALGVLEAPTDEAWAKALDQSKQKQEKHDA